MIHDKEPRKNPPQKKFHGIAELRIKKQKHPPIVIQKRRRRGMHNHARKSHPYFHANNSNKGNRYSNQSHYERGRRNPNSRSPSTNTQSTKPVSDRIKSTTQSPPPISRHPWLDYRSAQYDDSHLRSFQQPGEPSKENPTEFPQLDSTNSDQAHKIHKRQKMISYGKNTIGYDEYLKQVPKHLRQKRNPNHPNTPDATLDIPWKRFHGLTKAWRRTLHMYDPPDVLSSTNTTTPTNKNKHSAKKTTSVQDTELSQAAKWGLQVDFSVVTPPSPSTDVVGELDRLEIDSKNSSMIKKSSSSSHKEYTWYQSSDEEDEKMDHEESDDEDIL